MFCLELLDIPGDIMEEEVLEPEEPGAREKAALLPLRIRKNHRTQVLRGVLLLLLIRRMMKLTDL